MKKEKQVNYRTYWQMYELRLKNLFTGNFCEDTESWRILLTELKKIYIIIMKFMILTV